MKIAFLKEGTKLHKQKYIFSKKIPAIASSYEKNTNTVRILLL